MFKINKIGNKIDLGCGEECKKDFVGLDKKDFGQDIVWDITTGIPLPDDSVDEIYSSHFVEHLDEGGINIVFQEILRICKIGAIIHIICPHDEAPETYYLSHLTRWNEMRVKGICLGSFYWRKGTKKIKILSFNTTGIEINFKLEVYV